MADVPVIPSLIGNDRLTDGRHVDVLSPWDGRLLHRVAIGDAATLDRAVTAADAAFAETRRQPRHERADLLLRVAAGLTAQHDAFAALVRDEAGKPITLAEAEVDRAVVTCTDAAAEARQARGEVFDADAYAPGAGHFALARRFPLGVVYGIGPFNFPLNLIAHKIAPAIACGATIVLKPSPRTPAVAVRLAELILASGGVPGQVNVVHAENAASMDVPDDDRVKAVTFTGSAAVGWDVRRQAVKQKVTLELGGNAAVILHDDADLAAAVPAIAAGAFAFAGQSCISVQRVLVQRNAYAAVRDALLDRVKTYVVTGDPARRDVLNGPLIDAASRDRVLGLIASAVSAGGRVLCGGAAAGPCVLPTLLENVPPDHAAVAEEAFGPLAVLTPYDTFDDAIRLANASRYGLQAGVFTRDLGRAMTAFETLEVGGVLVNQVPTMRVDNLPYGGVKESGRGREGVRYAIEHMTELKTLVVRV